MQGIKGTITITTTTEYTIDNDELDAVKDDCWYAIDETIENALAYHFDIPAADVPPEIHDEVQKAIIEAMYKEYCLNQ